MSQSDFKPSPDDADEKVVSQMVTTQPEIDDWEDGEVEELPPMLPMGGRHLAVKNDSGSKVPVSDRGTVGVSQEPASTLRISDQPLDPTDLDQFPQLPGYKISRVLGRGGMGVVYLADDLRLGRLVAIKMVVFDSPNQEVKTRFQSEGQLLASIDHPGVAKVYEVGFAAGRPFLAMEYIEGQTLSDLAGGRPMTAKVAADWAAQLAWALHACHEKQIIHRDVKPSNAMVNREGKLKLTDFGLAKLTGQETRSRLTQTGDVMGTPAYMSPEQASGVVKRLSPRSDVYSVGAVLYELVTGRPPFTSPEPLQTVLMVLGQQPVPPRTLVPRVSVDLENIILKCLEKSPTHRYASCRELAEDLQRYMHREPVRAKAVPWQRKLAFWVKQHPALTTAIALMLLLIGSVIVGVGVHNSRLQAELQRTNRMVSNGREFSHWLLYDFSTALESDQGLTSLRKQLAAKSEENLSKMSLEVANDPVMKLEIADAQLRLSQLQVALGELQSARENLHRVHQGFQNVTTSSKDDIGILILATIREAEIDFEEEQTLAGAQRLEQARTMYAEARTVLTADRQLDLLYALTIAEVQLASRQGNVAKLEALIAELAEVQVGRGKGATTLEAEVAWLATIWNAKGALLVRLGETQVLLEELAPILSDLEQRLKNRPTPFGTHFQITSLERLLADALFQSQEFELAASLYQKLRHVWSDALERDPDNLELVHNLTLALQYEADCQMKLGELTDAKTLLDQALSYLERHQVLTGQDWQTRPVFVGFWGSLAYWHWLNGDSKEVVRLQGLMVDKLRPFAEQNVLFQQMVGESLLLIGLAKAQLYSERMTIEAADELQAMEQAYDDAQLALKASSDYFRDMEARGVLSPHGAGQKDRAVVMQEFLAEMHQRFLASFEIDGEL